MSPNAEDRRGFLRIPFTATVRIDADGGTVHADSEIDISMNGIRVPRPGPQPGSACRVTVVLAGAPDEVAIRAAGRIARSDQASTAVEFTELDPDSYHHLRQLILNNAADPEKAEEEFEAHSGIRQRRA